MRKYLLALWLVLSCAAPAAMALPPCTTGWIPVGADGDVTAFGEWQGRLVAGGSFSQIGGVNANGVAWWDGVTWHPFGQGLSGGKVLALAEFQGQLYAGGEFTNTGGVGLAYLARWNGTSWVLAGGTPSAPVDCLAVNREFPARGLGTEVDTLLLVGGRFTTIGALPIAYFGLWNGTSWNIPSGGPLNGAVYTFLENGGGWALGGAFTQFGATPSKYLVSVDLNLNQFFASGTNLNGAVRSIAFQNSPVVGVLAGEFTLLNADPRLRVFSITTGAMGNGFSARVRTVVLYAGLVFAGGDFLFSGVNSLVGLGKFDLALGGQWSSVQGGVNGAVWALKEFGNELWVGGQFLTVGGVPSRGIARYNGTSAPGIVSPPQAQSLNAFDTLSLTLGISGDYPGPYTYQWYLNDQPLENGARASGAVVDGASNTLSISEITPFEAGEYKVQVSGVCGVVYTSPPVNVSVGAIPACTPDWVQAFPASPQFNGPVRAVLAWDEDDFSGTARRTIVAGNFTKLGGASFLRVGEWDGAQFVQLGAGFNKSVNALVQFDFDGAGPQGQSLVAAGEFTKSGTTTINRVARWNGTAWEPIGLGFNGTVNALYEFDFDGAGGLPAQLVAAGAFSKSGTTPVSRVARWDGTQWRPLGAGLNGTVSALQWWDSNGAAPGGEVLVAGGAFTKTGSTKVNRIAMFDGNQWLAIGEGFGRTVFALSEFNGTLYAGGAFKKSGSDTVTRAAYWDGVEWLQMGDGFDKDVLSLEWFDEDGLGPGNSVLLAGGAFKKSGAAPINRLARWTGEGWEPVGAGADSTVRALREVDTPVGQPGAPALVIGGDFKLVDGLTQRAVAAYRCPVQNLAALRAAGRADEAAPARTCSIADVCGAGGPGTAPDGQVTADDVAAFVQAFVDDDVSADVAGAGEADGPDFAVTVDDLIAFVNAVGAGC